MATDTTSLTLRDGRTLSWREHGPHDGRVVVHHHGGLVSGAYASTAAATCDQLGIRLVSPDRPGIGASSPSPGRSTADGAADVEALLDHLGVQAAGAVGWSMGGQYAIATAARLPGRINRLVVVAGAVPLDRPGPREALNAMDRRLTRLAERHPRSARLAFSSLGAVARHSHRTASRSMARGLSEADHTVIASVGPDVMATAMAEAMAQPDGMAEEYRAWARPWGVPLAPVGCATHVLWGTTDRLIPGGWTTELTAGLAAERDDVDGAGHLFLLTDWRRVLAPFGA